MDAKRQIVAADGAEPGAAAKEAQGINLVITSSQPYLDINVDMVGFSTTTPTNWSVVYHSQ